MWFSKFVGFTGTSCANSKKSWVTLYIKHTKETHTQTTHEHTYIRPICTRTHIDTSELVGKHRTNNLPFFFLFLNDLCYLNSLSHTSRQKEMKDMWYDSTAFWHCNLCQGSTDHIAQISILKMSWPFYCMTSLLRKPNEECERMCLSHM